MLGGDMTKVKYHAYVGRFQSPHLGHKWLIDQHLGKKEAVLILVRDVDIDEKNPFKAEEVVEMLSCAFKKEIEEELVKIQIIPDIASVNYGRGVGYAVVEHMPNDKIKAISATEIRRRIRASEDGWQEMVMPGVEQFLKDKFSQ